MVRRIRGATDGGSDRYGLYIGGEFTPGDGDETFEASNPATGESLATMTVGTRTDVERAIEAARNVQPELEALTAFERADLCHELAAALEKHVDELAEWLAKDQGKPLEDASGEVGGGQNLLRMAAEDIKRDETPTHPSQDPGKRIFTMRKPHGVVAVITPWNYPVAIPIEYLAPALACGNSTVWIPAPSTSLIAMKVAEIFADTSLPDGAINVVTGEGQVVGNEAVANEGTSAVGFTGSSATGDAIVQAAGTKPVMLELGGNGPIIVLDDADLDTAVRRSAFSCYTNTGQDCAGGERILVHESLHDEFVAKLCEQARDFTVGDPFNEDTDLGPLNNPVVAAKVERHLADARDKGAEFAVEGGRVANAASELFFEPTVLTGVTSEMRVFREETFGPVAPVTSFSEDAEAIELANEYGTGLISGVFTGSLRRAFHFGDAIETGTVHINEGSCYWEQHTPFGGFSGKDSGYGRLGGRYSVEEMSQIKCMTVDAENVRY